MFGSLLILLILPLTDLARIRGAQFRPLMKFNVITFIFVFIILMWIGGSHAESPFIEIGQVATFYYFIWFTIIVPVTGIIENTLIDIATNKETSNNSNKKIINIKNLNNKNNKNSFLLIINNILIKYISPQLQFSSSIEVKGKDRSEVINHNSYIQTQAQIVSKTPSIGACNKYRYLSYFYKLLIILIIGIVINIGCLIIYCILSYLNYYELYINTNNITYLNSKDLSLIIVMRYRFLYHFWSYGSLNSMLFTVNFILFKVIKNSSYICKEKIIRIIYLYILEQINKSCYFLSDRIIFS